MNYELFLLSLHKYLKPTKNETDKREKYDIRYSRRYRSY